MARFSRDLHRGLTIYYEAASESANAFSADLDGAPGIVSSHWGLVEQLMKDLVGQWDIVSLTATSIEQFLDGKLRTEFVETARQLNIEELIENRKGLGAFPMGVSSPQSFVGVLSGDERGLISIFTEFKQRAEELRDLSQKQVDLLAKHRNLASSGEMYDVIYNRPLLLENKRHELMDFEESFHSRILELQIFNETAVQMTREVALRSEIPYHECRRSRIHK